MNRTYNANIHGRVFTIDEDAYNLLQNYLGQLRASFGSTAEGSEIVDDIEARISELFAEGDAINGCTIITIRDVNRVIETMGRPEDISDSPVQQGPSLASRAASRAAEFFSQSFPTRKRLFRNMQNRVFGGVFGGLAAYLGWDATIMRIGYAALACFTYFWPLTIVYLVAWMVIPPARTTRQILEMYGEPVNLDTVGQTILRNQTTPPPYPGSSANERRAAELQQADKSDFFSTLVSVLAKVCMAFLGIISGSVTLATGGAFLAITGVAIGAIFNPDLLTEFTQAPQIVSAPILSITFCAVVLLGIFIPAMALTWGACCVIFNAPSAGRKTIISLILIEMLLIIIGVVLGSTIVGLMA